MEPQKGRSGLENLALGNQQLATGKNGWGALDVMGRLVAYCMLGVIGL